MLFAMFVALVCVCVLNLMLIVVLTRPRDPEGVASPEIDDERREWFG
jgi:hypothetical protein